MQEFFAFNLDEEFDKWLFMTLNISDAFFNVSFILPL